MKLTHPCKDTCSGYSQYCAEHVASLQARVKALEQQLHAKNSAVKIRWSGISGDPISISPHW